MAPPTVARRMPSRRRVIAVNYAAGPVTELVPVTRGQVGRPTRDGLSFINAGITEAIEL